LIRYAPPEVFERLREAEKFNLQDFQKADVFSFGVCVWELLERQIPWDGFSAQEIRHQVSIGSRPNVELKAKKDKKIEFLQKMMIKCWKQDPLERPTMETVLEEIKDFMKDSSLFTLQTDLV